MSEHQSPWRYGGRSPARPDGKQGRTDLFVYLLDVATGWMMAGGFDAVAMEQARMTAMAEGWGMGALDPVANLVGVAARSGFTDAHPMVREALGLAMAACTVTPTFKRVLEDRGSVEGHWLVLVYTTKQGSRAANVAFAHSSVEDFLRDADMAHLARIALADHLDPNQEFGGDLASRGGVQIAPNLVPLIG